jgi:hypothetical protein
VKTFQLYGPEKYTCPPYTAVSYVWGHDSVSIDKILVEGNLNFVQSKLRRVLEGVKDSEWRKYYWIDAICIDPSNLSERNAQVQIMGSSTPEQHPCAPTSTIWTEKNFGIWKD